MKIAVCKLTLYVLFFTCILLSFSCQKEVSFEQPSNNPTTPGGGTGTSGSTAEFSLVASGTGCSDAIVAGNYEKGKAVTMVNMVAFSVNVTKIGTWTYSTGRLSGIGFSGSGSFANTGVQIITLSATGTPTAEGDLSFPLNMGTATCNFSVKVGVTGGSTGPITATYYYKATIDGVDYRQTVTDDNGFEAGSGMGGDRDVVFGGGINYANPPMPLGKTSIGVSKGIMHNYTSATDAQFKAFFTPGDYPYSAPGSSEGVGIGWTDPTGEHWDSSAFGSGDQTGSSFKIISVVDNYDAIHNYYIRVKIQFSCKLYSMSNGSMKEAKNGEMVVLFGKL